jgi:hypothetical protein
LTASAPIFFKNPGCGTNAADYFFYHDSPDPPLHSLLGPGPVLRRRAIFEAAGLISKSPPDFPLPFDVKTRLARSTPLVGAGLAKRDPGVPSARASDNAAA